MHDRTDAFVGLPNTVNAVDISAANEVRSEVSRVLTRKEEQFVLGVTSNDSMAPDCSDSIGVPMATQEASVSKLKSVAIASVHPLGKCGK